MLSYYMLLIFTKLKFTKHLLCVTWFEHSCCSHLHYPNCIVAGSLRDFAKFTEQGAGHWAPKSTEHPSGLLWVTAHLNALPLYRWEC